jgi:hypothetical protein
MTGSPAHRRYSRRNLFGEGGGFGVSRRLARSVTYGLCGTLLLLGAAQIELWPLSAFRLFSSVRGPETVSWVVVTVDTDGGEHALDLSRMHGSVGLPHHVLPTLVDASPAERTRVVKAYVDAAGEGASAVDAKVYRVVSRTSTEADVPSAEVSRDLAYEVVLP